jgi:hypothetical protein
LRNPDFAAYFAGEQPTVRLNAALYDRNLQGFALKLQDGHSIDIRTFEEATSTDAIGAPLGGEIAYEFYSEWNDCKGAAHSDVALQGD